MTSPSDRVYILHPTDGSLPFTLYFHPLYRPQSIWASPAMELIYILFIGTVPVNSYFIPELEQAFSKAAYTVSPLFTVTEQVLNIIPSEGRDIPGLSSGLLTAVLQDMDMVTLIWAFCCPVVVFVVAAAVLVCGIGVVTGGFVEEPVTGVYVLEVVLLLLPDDVAEPEVFREWLLFEVFGWVVLYVFPDETGLL